MRLDDFGASPVVADQKSVNALLTRPVKSESLKGLMRRLCGVPEYAERLQVFVDHVKALPSQHILLGEDSRVNQLVAIAMLRKMGHQVEAVENGLEALHKLKENDYDLVFMDCQMPEVDGYQATRSLRSPGSGVRNTRIPVIAMTANAMVGDREKCLAAGMDDYIAKPIRVEEVISALNKWGRHSQ